MGPVHKSSTADVRGMRGVGGMCLARDGVGGEYVRGLGLGFTNPVGTRGVLDVCLGCGGGEYVGGLDQGLEWGCVMSV